MSIGLVIGLLIAFALGMLFACRLDERDYDSRLHQMAHDHADDLFRQFELGRKFGQVEQRTAHLRADLDFELSANESVSLATEWTPNDREIRDFTTGESA